MIISPSQKATGSVTLGFFLFVSFRFFLFFLLVLLWCLLLCVRVLNRINTYQEYFSVIESHVNIPDGSFYDFAKRSCYFVSQVVDYNLNIPYSLYIYHNFLYFSEIETEERKTLFFMLWKLFSY